MELRDYLHKNRIKIIDFARQLEYGRTYINEIVNGTKRPGKRLAKEIERQTGGEVTVRELLGE